MSRAPSMSLEELSALGLVVQNGVARRLSAIVAPPPPKASERAWPVMRYPLPRPASLAREIPTETNAVSDLFRKHGCTVKSTVQFRKSKVALGIPDLWVFGPPGSRRAWWFEVKSGEDWAFSVDQLKWAGNCMASEQLYGAGDRGSAQALLFFLNLEPIG